MIVLKIVKPGYTFNLPGMNNIKTPVAIDITKMSTDIVISTMRKNGINKFEIVSSEKTKLPKPITEENVISKPIHTVEKIYVKEDNSEVKNRLNNIEFLLSKFIKDNEDNIFKYKEPKSKKEKEIEEKVDYIPSIDTSGFKTKGNISHKTTKNISHDTIKESASLLNSIVKK